MENPSTQSDPHPPTPAEVLAPLALPPGVTPAMEDAFAQLQVTVLAKRPNEDIASLRRAFEFASLKHAPQTRDSGEPYMLHPLAVTQTLA
jgi:GTP pyrophosphokinase